MRCENWAELDVVITGGPDREGGGSGPVVMLLHGFGAPGDDLVALWRMLDVSPEVRFLFPAGPLSLNLGFGDSRAWWMLDMDRLTQARSRGEWEKLSRETPAGMSLARNKMMNFLTEAERHLNIPPQHFVIGGFSQGAMLACELALRTELRIAGLIMMSGTMISRDSWVSSIPHRKGLPVFQSHGTDDPLLACVVAQQLRDAFIEGGLEVDWHEFRGGHEISVKVLEELGKFLRRVLSKSNTLPNT